MEEAEKGYKIHLVVKKPTDLDDEDVDGKVDIFKLVYLGKLTVIVDYFEEFTEGEVHNLLSEKDDNGNTPFDIACFLGIKNIVLYFLKWGADPASVDLKQRNCFHFLCFKREYSTLMTIQNFIINKYKEKLHLDIVKAKRTYGLKNIDVKNGELVKSGYISKKIHNNFKDFIAAIESLAINTYEDYVQFYRNVLAQQDADGRNPLHFSAFEKLIVALLTFGINNDEGFDEFSEDCQQLRFLEHDSIKQLDPRKHFSELNEFKQLLDPKVYGRILKGYNKGRKNLIKEIVNTQDINDQTPLHIVSRRGNYVLVRYFLRIGADSNKRDVKRHNPLDIAKDKYVRQALTNLNAEADKGNESNIDKLCEEGENINTRNSILGEAPIHKAVLCKAKNKLDALKAIIDQDADINIVDNNGWTPLHH
jgi:ankyrin repeat protein